MAMKTMIVKINPDLVESEKIKEIARILSSGAVIVYPTETFYALGANCFSRKAIQEIYRLKKRPPSKPLSVVISDMEMLRQIVLAIPPDFETLVSVFWPGPLTLVLKASSRVPKELQSLSGSIGVRLTGHEWLRAMVRHASFPITATSANISGGEEIANPEEAVLLFDKRVNLIVNAGETKGRLPSTVLDLTGRKPRLIREGAIPSSQLKKYLLS
jgi:L-threonylcarbamoyladenylate synthase